MFDWIRADMASIKMPLPPQEWHTARVAGGQPKKPTKGREAALKTRGVRVMQQQERTIQEGTIGKFCNLLRSWKNANKGPRVSLKKRRSSFDYRPKANWPITSCRHQFVFEHFHFITTKQIAPPLQNGVWQGQFFMAMLKRPHFILKRLQGSILLFGTSVHCFRAKTV